MTPIPIKLTPFSDTEIAVIQSPPIRPRPPRRVHPLHRHRLLRLRRLPLRLRRLPLRLRRLPLRLRRLPLRRLRLVKTSIEVLTIKERSVLS